VRNNQPLDRYLQDFKLTLAIEEGNRMPFRVVAARATEPKRLELFANERLGSSRFRQTTPKLTTKVNRPERRRFGTAMHAGQS
jgi:hypothetical protein